MITVMTLITSTNPLSLLACATGYFLLIYVIFASLAWTLASIVDRPMETRAVDSSQVRTELLNSLRSIVLFGAGMLVPWGMIQIGLTTVDGDAGVAKIIVECLALVLWNDLHFYAMHRLLHEKLKKSHVTHHRSIAATSFASYSMSATEALLLGSVMPIAMLAHAFSVEALLFLPVWSIFINTLSHSNCDLFPRTSEHSLLGFIHHHQTHHSRYHGNYSFFFGHLDQWLGTSSHPQHVKKDNS
jgi:lathosterol oxidase